MRGGGNERSATLFHEMLHIDPRFDHRTALEEASGKACKLAITDRLYACEAMCFSPEPDRCQCTRCLSPEAAAPTKEACEKCADQPACPGRQEPGPNGGSVSISSAIGAWCDRTKTFCDTKAECDSECPVKCQQIKATCDASCN